MTVRVLVWASVQAAAARRARAGGRRAGRAATAPQNVRAYGDEAVAAVDGVG